MSKKKEPTTTIELDAPLSRSADAAPCPCGGYADRVDLTTEEIKSQSCGQSYECCGRAFVCRVCKARLVGEAEAPELRYD
jgi:hypothetical protein